MVFILDLNGRIIQMNETVRRKLLLTQEKLLNNDIIFVHIPEQRDIAKSILLDIIAGKIDLCTVPLMAKEGSRIEVETRVTGDCGITVKL